MTILESALADAGSLRDRQRCCSARRRRGRDSNALEIAADEPQNLRRGIAKRRAVARDRPREHVVDHHGRNGGRKPESGRQQRLGDARRNHREVGGMRFRDADEAVHDAPYGAEQADERGGRTDGGEHTGAAQDPSPEACFDALEAGSDPFLDAFSVGGTGGDLQLGHGRIEELHDLALSIGKPLDPLGGGAYADELIQCRPHTSLGQHEIYGFGEPHCPVDDRSKGKADQYRLHHRIGVEIHAPWAEIARQRGRGNDIVLRERRHGHDEPCYQRGTAQHRGTYAPRTTQDSNSSPMPFPKFPLDQTHYTTTYHAGIRALSGDPISFRWDRICSRPALRCSLRRGAREVSEKADRVGAQEVPDEFLSDQGKCYASAGRRRTARPISSGRFLAPTLRLSWRQVLTTVL